VALLDAISPDEPPLVILYGSSGSAIIGSDRRALVFKTGVRAGIPFGSRLKSFEYESILSVDMHRSVDTGVVVIHAPVKIATCSSYWADERDDPWKARNAIPVRLPDQRIEEGASMLADLVAEVRRGHELAAQARAPGARAGEHWPPELLEPRNPDRRKTHSIEPAAATGLSRGNCSRCGARLRVSWHFCPRCGEPAGSGQARSGERRRSSSG
jgi:hypothetical protein